MIVNSQTGTTLHEIAPDVFRISTFVPQGNLQFNQFLVRDEEPLLYHTGMRGLFPAVREAVAKVLDPSTLRWISFSHFEADESGALNEWLQLAPRAQAACSLVGAEVSVNDFALRPARSLMHDEVLSTGRHRFRFQHTPHVPHCWDAGLLFEETEGILFCSDLFHQLGDVEPATESDLIDRFVGTLTAYRSTPFDHYLPYTPRTRPILESLAALRPRVLLPMHGSAYVGDGEKASRKRADAMHESVGSRA
jgi:flavorubredoxin